MSDTGIDKKPSKEDLLKNFSQGIISGEGDDVTKAYEKAAVEKAARLARGNIVEHLDADQTAKEDKGAKISRGIRLGGKNSFTTRGFKTTGTIPMPGKDVGESKKQATS